MIRSSAARSSVIGSRLFSERVGWAWCIGPRHERLNKVRALKLLPRNSPATTLSAIASSASGGWRRRSSTPSIVEVIDAGETGDHLYILMRLVDGPDLAKLVKEEGPLSPERTLDLLEQIGDALDAAHSQGVVHLECDAPEHPRRCGRPCVSRRLRRGPDDGDAGADTHGYFVGNLDYAAPEQIDGTSVDGRVDVYALGGVVFTSLTGCAPYDRESDVQ